MISDDKIKEITKKIRAGIPEGEIKEELTRSGYSNEDVAKAFAPRQYDMRSWYLFFAIILFFAGVWLYLNRNSLLGFILSALLFLQYYREIERLKKGKI
jgi:hypothetical protein